MSSQPLNHAYSFEHLDEAPLQPRSQARTPQQPVQQQQQYQAYQPYQYAQPYRDASSPPPPLPPQQQYAPYKGGPSPPPIERQDYHDVSPPSFAHPGAHPDSAYSRLQASRKYGAGGASPPPPVEGGRYNSRDRAAEYTAELPTRGDYGFPIQGASPAPTHRNQIPRVPVGGAAYGGSIPAATGTLTSGPTPQPPPSHPELPLPTDTTASRSQSPLQNQQAPQSPSRLVPPAPATDNNGRYWGRELGYSNSTRTTSSATPGMDNLGDSSVGGGITGLAMGVAANNERESGVQALHAIENGGHAGPPGQEGTPSTMRPYEQERLRERSSYGSTVPLGAAAAGMPIGSAGSRMNVSDDGSFAGSHPSQERYLMGDVGGDYADNPYNQYSSTWDPRVSQTGFVGIANPELVVDDGDDGLHYSTQDPKRRSVLSLGRSNAAGGAAVAGGTTTGGVLGTLGGLVGRNNSGGNGATGVQGSQYGLVSTTGETEYGSGPEKSEWLSKQSTGNKKMKWIVGALITLLILGAVAGGVVGGILGSKKNSSGGGSSSADSSSAVGADAAAAAAGGSGDLNKNSAEIKKLMNNPNLHKVFPGMDYTPLNAALYPECLTNGPNQNNVTRDMAVLSQLTNTIRLYGTDCNQTEMVLHSIKVLGLTDMKVWLGVWQDGNATTNVRQLDQMYQLLDKYGADPFRGVIIGNEVLFRKEMTEWQLSQVISGVKTNLTAKGVSLPIATADLGDNWTATLAAAVDVVMSNIHPFFAGVTASAATGWAWDFWQTHDVALTASLGNKGPKHIISEIGWPSAGGNDCGTTSACPDKTSGSVAGVVELNIFMADFVCNGLANGTDYFWFEAFDEPWKIQFDTGNDNWEDKWGLMDVNRKLKDGVKVPSCGGKTI